jgi:hypothetical protein
MSTEAATEAFRHAVYYNNLRTASGLYEEEAEEYLKSIDQEKVLRDLKKDFACPYRKKIAEQMMSAILGC